jgi:Ca-activated chloride channel family protein
MKQTIGFTFEKVRFDVSNDAHLVISLTAPKIDWQSKRAPICVVPSIDLSGSMAGEKLEYAKKSVMKLIDHLQPGDFAGVVVFESNYKVLHPIVEITQATKDALKSKVGALTTLGSTNFAGGMLLALEEANKADLPAGTIARVIMFSDGQPNVGVATQSADLVTLFKANRGKVSISAFAYGEGADQELMANLSNAGEGNYAFIKDPEQALNAFAKELGGLLSTYAQNVTLTVVAHGDHEVSDVLSDVDVTERQGRNSNQASGSSERRNQTRRN